jgi:hypothetical protein
MHETKSDDTQSGQIDSEQLLKRHKGARDVRKQIALHKLIQQTCLQSNVDEAGEARRPPRRPRKSAIGEEEINQPRAKTFDVYHRMHLPVGFLPAVTVVDWQNSQLSFTQSSETFRVFCFSSFLPIDTLFEPFFAVE